MRSVEPIIITDNEDFVAVSKPSGMLTLPDRHDEELKSLRGWMEAKFGKIWVVHRLDKDTSGLILFAKHAEAHHYLNSLFENRAIEKKYLGIISGKPIHATGSIEEPIAEHSAKNGTMIIHTRGKASHTDYEVIKSWNNFSLVEFNLHTGRTHQIRVHCKHLGHPIVCDPLYGDGKPVLLSSLKKKFNLAKDAEAENPLFNRLALHSHSLAFKGLDGTAVKLEAPLPKDMSAFIKQLDKLYSKKQAYN